MLQTKLRFGGALLLLLGLMSLTVLADSASSKSDLLRVLNAAQAANSAEIMKNLDALDRKGTKADSALIVLLDYYIGEGSSVVLAEAISRRGKRMLNRLEAKRTTVLNCLPEYVAICMSKFNDGLAVRNEHVDRLTSAIRSGKVLRVPR